MNFFIKLFFFSILFISPSYQQVTAEETQKVVEVTRVKKEVIYQSVRLIGTVKAKKSSILVAKISGTITSIVPSGTKVSKGQVIAQLENTHLKNSVRLSQEASNIAKKQYNRAATLQKSGFVSKKNMEEIESTLIDNQQKLAEAKIKLDESRFVAPFDGVVGPHKLREGSHAQDGDEILTFYDPTDLIVEVDIPAQHFASLESDPKIKIDNKIYPLGFVQKIVNPDTHMASTTIDIPDTNHFIGEPLFVDLLVKEHKDALIIPSEAIFLKDNKQYVYLVTGKENELSLQAITPGIQEKEKTEILQGLKEGDLVVVRGQDRLYPGLSVKYILI